MFSYRDANPALWQSCNQQVTTVPSKSFHADQLKDRVYKNRDVIVRAFNQYDKDQTKPEVLLNTLTELNLPIMPEIKQRIVAPHVYGSLALSELIKSLVSSVFFPPDAPSTPEVFRQEYSSAPVEEVPRISYSQYHNHQLVTSEQAEDVPLRRRFDRGYAEASTSVPASVPTPTASSYAAIHAASPPQYHQSPSSWNTEYQSKLLLSAQKSNPCSKVHSAPPATAPAQPGHTETDAGSGQSRQRLSDVLHDYVNGLIPVSVVRKQVHLLGYPLGNEQERMLQKGEREARKSFRELLLVFTRPDPGNLHHHAHPANSTNLPAAYQPPVSSHIHYSPPPSSLSSSSSSSSSTLHPSSSSSSSSPSSSHSHPTNIAHSTHSTIPLQNHLSAPGDWRVEEPIGGLRRQGDKKHLSQVTLRDVRSPAPANDTSTQLTRSVSQTGPEVYGGGVRKFDGHRVATNMEAGSIPVPQTLEERDLWGERIKKESKAYSAHVHSHLAATLVPTPEQDLVNTRGQKKHVKPSLAAEMASSQQAPELAPYRPQIRRFDTSANTNSSSYTSYMFAENHAPSASASSSAHYSTNCISQPDITSVGASGPTPAPFGTDHHAAACTQARKAPFDPYVRRFERLSSNEPLFRRKY